ncbi:MAG: TetR/AcrR family transcriptional regulator [Proteobacteria bacterium]|nr:TetR/AcrR family transcriptional regulator [Pseudomonadota bacterium]
MKTKDRILSIALQLFNEEGTKAVSTNHIADAASMSPGNLYYHFENKGEIVREIFLKMIQEFESTDCNFRDDSPCIEQMGVHVQQVLEVQWKYRFIQSEVMTLVDHDPWLKERMVIVNQERLEEFKGLLYQMIEQEQMVELPAETITFLARSSWIVSIFWQPYLNLCGEKITKARLSEGIQQIFYLLQPYLKNPELMKKKLG